MQERHNNRKQYFEEQAYTTSKYVIPFIEQSKPVDRRTRILEIGCGEGGNIGPFLELGCEVVGIDLNEVQINRARKYLSETFSCERLQLLANNIYNITSNEVGQFDLIIMRDVIEHIFDQDKFMAFLLQFLAPGGHVFFGFPPWYMPFGGHQQICKSKLLSTLPYYHLLPRGVYHWLLKTSGESEEVVKDLLEIKQTGISIERFRRILNDQGYTVVLEQLYFINPNYEVKFNLRPRPQCALIGGIPFFRNVMSTCCYSLVSRRSQKNEFAKSRDMEKAVAGK